LKTTDPAIRVLANKRWAQTSLVRGLNASSYAISHIGGDNDYWYVGYVQKDGMTAIGEKVVVEIDRDTCKAEMHGMYR
jgi:hypothetical protein